MSRFHYVSANPFIFYSHQHTHLEFSVPSPETAPQPRSLIGQTRYQRLSNLLTEITLLRSVTKAFLTTQQARCTLTSASVIPTPSIRQLKDFFLRGTEGIDFAVNIKIEALDFGTFHVRLRSFQSNTGANSRLLNSSYTPFVMILLTQDLQLTPSQESWFQKDDPIGFGNKWITDHVAQMEMNKKPVLLEEFGAADIKSTAFPSWFSTVINSGLTGDLIW